jgi:hypothetical protein
MMIAVPQRSFFRVVCAYSALVSRRGAFDRRLLHGANEIFCDFQQRAVRGLLISLSDDRFQSYSQRLRDALIGLCAGIV